MVHLSLIQPFMMAISKFYTTIEYAYMTIPTYPSGQIGFIIASRQENSIKTKSTCQILVRMTTTKMV